MRIFIAMVMILALCVGTCFADKLIIQRSCYPRELQKEFLDKGYVLDLNGIDRTKESWGFLVNEGNQFSIYTYQSLTDEELKDMLTLLNVEDK